MANEAGGVDVTDTKLHILMDDQFEAYPLRKLAVDDKVVSFFVLFHEYGRNLGAHGKTQENELMSRNRRPGAYSPVVIEANLIGWRPDGKFMCPLLRRSRRRYSPDGQREGAGDDV